MNSKSDTVGANSMLHRRNHTPAIPASLLRQPSLGSLLATRFATRALISATSELNSEWGSERMRQADTHIMLTYLTSIVKQEGSEQEGFLFVESLVA